MRILLTSNEEGKKTGCSFVLLFVFAKISFSLFESIFLTIATVLY